MAFCFEMLPHKIFSSQFVNPVHKKLDNLILKSGCAKNVKARPTSTHQVGKMFNLNNITKLR